MGSQLSALRTKLAERGYHYLLAGGIADGFINDAISELCSEEDWDFLVTGGTGTGPLTPDGFDTLLSCRAVTGNHVLSMRVRAEVQQSGVSLDEAGTPLWLYMIPGGFDTWPRGPVSYEYVRSPAELASDGAECVVPSRWDQMILAKAEQFAAEHAKNEAIAQARAAAYERGLIRMRDRELDPQRIAERNAFAYVGEWA